MASVLIKAEAKTVLARTQFVSRQLADKEWDSR